MKNTPTFKLPMIPFFIEPSKLRMVHESLDLSEPDGKSKIRIFEGHQRENGVKLTLFYREKNPDSILTVTHGKNLICEFEIPNDLSTLHQVPGTASSGNEAGYRAEMGLLSGII